MKFTKKQAEVARLLDRAVKGDEQAKSVLAEGISTSDIPVQLTPSLNKIALKNYNDVEKIWQNWATPEEVPDFESNPYYNFSWGDEDIERENAGTKFVEGGLPRIPEYGEYPVLRFEATEQALKTAKSGVQIKFSWESLYKTRNFGLLNRTFAEFGKRAAFTENVEATKPLVVGTGLNTNNFNAGNQNLLPGNPALTLESLEDAIEYLSEGNQVYNGVRVPAAAKYVLVVPRSLEMTARRILAVQEVTAVEGAGTASETRIVSGNPVAGKIDLVVNDYLTEIAGNAVNGYWFLVPVPGAALNPTVVNVFLEGERGPRIFVQKTTTGNPADGAFIDDSYSTKVRQVVAGGFISPAGTLVSTGAGS